MTKKSDIKAPLKIVTVPKNLLRTHRLQHSGEVSAVECRQSNEDIAFQVACMKELSREEEIKKSSEESLKLHPKEYADLIREYPNLLSPTFKKGEPTHGVYHYIDTADHKPTKAKRRPLIADAEKARKGKEAWDKMIADGVIEMVKPGQKTDWSSALHLVNKPGPCSDFRC